MLWPSIRRWKFQRSRIGKLPDSAWCLNIVCSAASTMLPASTAASTASVPPSRAQSSAAGTAASQSTMRPIMAKSSASKAPMAAENSVISAMYGRMPALQAQMKGQKRCGMRGGGASG